MSFEALSRVSRAVMLLSRASLGSDTLNIPVMMSGMRVALLRNLLQLDGLPCGKGGHERQMSRRHGGRAVTGSSFR